MPNGIVGGVEITEGAAQIDGVVEFELTSAMIAAGQTGTTMLDAQGSGTLIDVTHVTITPTNGHNNVRCSRLRNSNRCNPLDRDWETSIRVPEP